MIIFVEYRDRNFTVGAQRDIALITSLYRQYNTEFFQLKIRPNTYTFIGENKRFYINFENELFDAV